MNDPQVWSLIGLFAGFVTVTFGLQRFNNRSIERMIVASEQSTNARFDGVHQRFDGVEQSLNARVDGLEQSVNAKVDGLAIDVGHRLDNVERDLGLIKGHLLGQRSA